MVEFRKVEESALVKACDMTSETQLEVIDIVTAAVEKQLTTENFEKASQSIKETMDKKFGGTWHCCIGEGFGFEVEHETRSLLYLQYQKKLGILVYKN